MNTDTMGVYGNYYLKRAIVALVGLGANLHEDAVYPLNLGDADGKPLTGANKYKIHFAKREVPCERILVDHVVRYERVPVDQRFEQKCYRRPRRAYSKRRWLTRSLLSA